MLLLMLLASLPVKDGGLGVRRVIIPAKAFARDYVITGVRLSVQLSVCLSVTTITK